MRSFFIVAVLASFVSGCASAPAVDRAEQAGPIEASGVTLVVKGLSCPLCATNVDKQMMALPGVASADVDLSTGEIVVEFSAFTEHPTEAALRAAIVDAGYTLESVRLN